MDKHPNLQPAEEVKLTPHDSGFSWGPARVTRISDDVKYGVWLMISSHRQHVEIRITKDGFIRIGTTVKETTPTVFAPFHSPCQPANTPTT